MKVIERRVAKLEATSAHTAQMPVVFICLVPSERAVPATATVGGRVARCWRSWIDPSLRLETAGTMRIARTGLRATEGNGQSHGQQKLQSAGPVCR
jgi:hypothetical protein